jgi:hypothetical protein
MCLCGSSSAQTFRMLSLLYTVEARGGFLFEHDFLVAGNFRRGHGLARNQDAPDSHAECAVGQRKVHEFDGRDHVVSVPGVLARFSTLLR